jgi:LysW-gamma-L-lysine carboxypeptidase
MNARDYEVRLLNRMLNTYSPSGQEKEIADLIIGEMERIGFRVSKDEVGNVIGQAGVGSPCVMLCGHMDTIPGFIPVRIENGKMYGRGAVDAKASLASLIAASAEMIKKRFRGHLQLAAVVDEEGEGKGIRNIIKKGLCADYAVFGEPSGVGNVTIAYKGSVHLKVTCETQTGHVAAPWLFENAIENTFEVWKAIANIHFAEEDLESRFYSTTSCVTRIEGGDSFSTVPSKCSLHADIRIPPRITLERFQDRAQDCAEQFRRRHPDTNVIIELENGEEPFETDKSSALVRAFTWAIRKITANPAVLVRKSGTGDINAFATAIKRPMIAYGPGNSHLDHTANEHVNIREYLDAIQVLQEALNRLALVHSRKLPPTSALEK